MDMSNIAERLEVKFGLGTRPQLRRQLFERLACLVYEGNGDAERIYQVIASVAVDAETKRQPDHYFCSVVLRRLQECKLLPTPEI